MTEQTAVAINFKDIDVDERVRETVQKRCDALSAEFPETTHIEVTLTHEGDGHAGSSRVTGRGIDVAAHATADELGHTADRLLDKLERQLRRVHDKRIFARRREAQKDRHRRGDAS